MKHIFLIGGLIALFATACTPTPQKSRQQADAGTLIFHDAFTSKHFPTRDVLVWLPEGYTPEERYAVLYMHDAQMLFDATTSWNKQTWNVDSVATATQRDGRCRPFIVVGIENHPKGRLVEYMPERMLDYLPADNSSLQKIGREQFIADDYLKFLVEELKPFIDSHYSTLTDRDNTVVMGSSMGGLISLYALAEYPEVFGGAGCLSTHSVVAVDAPRTQAPTWGKAFRDYLNDHLPAAEGHRVYMDYGDQTLDAAYEPYQKAIDSLFAAKGWGEANFCTRFFAGHAHDERSWQSRLHIPFAWLLAADLQ